MKILVTGDTGFIGCHIVKYLRSLKHSVYGCSRSLMGGRGMIMYVDRSMDLTREIMPDGYNHFALDLSNRECVVKLLSECKPDCIVHCAADAAPQKADGGLYDMYKNNVNATLTLCNEAPQGCQFIFLSSIVVYGDVDESIPTSNIDACWPTIPTSFYGLTKMQAEDIVFFHKNKLKIKILRLGAVVGSGLTHGIIYDFIRKLKSDSKELQVLGDKPGSTKPFLHITDLLKILYLCIEEKIDIDGQKVYNICNSNYATVEDIANNVMDVIGIHKPISWLGPSANWKGDNKVLRAQVDNLGVGWEPVLTSVEAIRLAVKENL